MSTSRPIIQRFAIPKTTNMKKNHLFRPEHLLLVVPALAYAILFAFYPELNRYIMLMDGASTLDYYDLLFIQTLFMISTFFVHKIMQVAGVASVQMKRLQVVASVVLMLSLAIVFINIPDVGRNWHNQIFPTPTYERWMSMSYFCSMAMGLFLLLQVGFIVFGIVRTVVHTGRKAKYSSMSAA